LSVDGAAPEATPFEEYDAFEPGDSVTIRLDRDDDYPPIRIVYSEPGGNSSMTLFTYDVPEDDA
jgi:hypothetical protein